MALPSFGAFSSSLSLPTRRYIILELFALPSHLLLSLLLIPSFLSHILLYCAINGYMLDLSFFFLFLSISSLYLFSCPSIFLSLSISFYLCPYVLLAVYRFLFLSLSFSLSFYLFLCLSLYSFSNPSELLHATPDKSTHVFWERSIR